MRSYPASTTSCTLCDRKKSRIAASRSPSVANCFSESSPSGMLRSPANAAPTHDGRFVATATTSKPLSTRLRRLEPFPETTTPIFNGVPAKSEILWGGVSGDHHAFAALVLDHLADHLGAAWNFVRGDYEDHAKAHVERPKHLVVGDVAAAADELEDRTDFP